MLMEVRCCCVPAKLIGWLEVDPAQSTVLCPLRVERDDRVTRYRDPPPVHFEQVVLPIATFTDFTVGSWRCVKAEGMPLEKLRHIPGFRENDGSVELFFRQDFSVFRYRPIEREALYDWNDPPGDKPQGDLVWACASMESADHCVRIFNKLRLGTSGEARSLIASDAVWDMQP